MRDLVVMVKARVSISEAKTRLSALLDRVRAGESVIITDRGVPVARIVRAVAPGSGDEEARLRRLERAGVIRWALTPVDLDWLFGRPLPTPRQRPGSLARGAAQRRR